MTMTMWRTVSMLVIVVCLCWGAACRSSSVAGSGAATTPSATSTSSGPAVAKAPLAPPRTPAECKACNGVWGVHGISQEESCNCRTHDGGKRCLDGADCEGMCVAADAPERDVIEAGTPPRGFFVGRCSELMTVFGCNRFIDRGASARGPTPLAEPPAQLCVD
jgi:hypothetical protein